MSLTRRLSPLLIILAAALLEGCAARCAVKKEETAELYPTVARWNAEEKAWDVPVHGRIYKPGGGLVSEGALSLFRTIMQMTPQGETFRVFEERASGFLVKAPSGRNVRVDVADRSYKAGELDRGGHFEKTVRVSSKRAGWDAAQADPAATRAYEIKSCETDEPLAGNIYFLKDEGLSVISTIEGTIQDVNLAQRPELFKDLLFRPYREVEGMRELYSEWQRRGASFHYVAASPWQLYPSVSRFVQNAGFPAGSFAMPRWLDTGGSALSRLENVVSLFNADNKAKSAEIAGLVESFPKRRFILVGNTGTSDPEVFGDVARRFPERIERIFLRSNAAAPNPKRITDALQSVPTGKWEIFDEPSQVEGRSVQTGRLR